MRALLASGFGLAIILAGAVASAQQPPDVVRLRDGGLLRGTIQEYSPGESVLIVLPNGEQRRIDASRIEFAGPAAELPPPRVALRPSSPPAPPFAPPPAPLVVQLAPPLTFPVRFESDRPSLQIFRIVGAEQQLRVTSTRYGTSSRLESNPVYERVCMTPCEVAFQPGFYGLGVSGGGGIARPQDPGLHIAGPTRVHVGWIGRELVRIIGWVIALAGGSLGVAGVIGGLTAFGEARAGASGWRDFALVSGGLAVASLGVGLPLAFWRDSYWLTQDPPIPSGMR